MRKINTLGSNNSRNTENILRYVPCNVDSCSRCYARCPQSGPLSTVKSNRDASQGGKASI